MHDELASRWGRLDGFLHAIAFAPQDALGGNFLQTPWESVQTAFQTSAFSLKAIAVGMLPLMRERGGAIASLDFDATVAWPVYDWMGVCKAGLESVTRYLARDLGPHGIRVNTVSAGPAEDHRGQGDPGVRADRRRLGRRGRRSDGTSATRRRWPQAIAFTLSDFAVGDHRRDDPRRRRIPRDGHGAASAARSLARGIAGSADPRAVRTPARDADRAAPRGERRAPSARPSAPPART